MSNEIALAAGWIATTAQSDSALTSAATGGVWQDKADIGVTAPYLLYAFHSGTDTATANAHRLFSRMLWQIKAVGPVSQYSTLVTIANRIEHLFGGDGLGVRSVGLSSGGVLESWRNQPLSYPDEVNGVAWVHLGGLYMIDLQGA